MRLGGGETLPAHCEQENFGHQMWSPDCGAGRGWWHTGHRTSVASFPSGSSEGDVLVGIEQVHWDADHAMTALLFVFDGQVRSGLVRNDAGVAGWGVGGDPPGALGTFELSGVRLVGSGKHPASRIADRSPRQPFRV